MTFTAKLFRQSSATLSNPGRKNRHETSSRLNHKRSLCIWVSFIFSCCFLRGEFFHFYQFPEHESVSTCNKRTKSWNELMLPDSICCAGKRCLKLWENKTASRSVKSGDHFKFKNTKERYIRMLHIRKQRFTRETCFE